MTPTPSAGATFANAVTDLQALLGAIDTRGGPVVLTSEEVRGALEAVPFLDRRLVARRARQIKLVNMYAYGALTVGLEGKELAEMGLLGMAVDERWGGSQQGPVGLALLSLAHTNWMMVAAAMIFGRGGGGGGSRGGGLYVDWTVFFAIASSFSSWVCWQLIKSILSRQMYK